MKVIIDDKIPYIKGALEPFAEVIYLPGAKTDATVVKDADAIITRTRTICNANLLEGSLVKMIATATIGFDHIDTDYCEKAGIEWTNAPGCNSWSVAQFIMSALYTLSMERNYDLDKITIGIIGAGNVGSKVAKLCKTVGMNVLVNDPPRQRTEGDTGFSSLEEIHQQADIITFHTPLIRDGIDKTYHLLDDNFIMKCQKKVTIINSSRGEVTKTEALKKGLKSGKINDVIIDCWENEPEIDLALLEMAFIATPHIAGYSKDGKANGTSMSIQALSRKFSLGIDNWECSGIELPENTQIFIDGENKSKHEIIRDAVLYTYPIFEDSKRLKKSVTTFEKQRGDYPIRREFTTYNITTKNVNHEVTLLLSNLGFMSKAHS